MVESSAAAGERWIQPASPILTDYREVKEPVQLQTETRYFQVPQLSFDENNWLKPGSYDAFEASGDWVHINTEHGQVWVNAARALLERPLGIVAVDETITLTEDTETFRYPLTGELSHIKGFYSPQSVQAYEKWISDTGDIWYHFHGFGGDEWMKKADDSS
ncbi:hypothetical protein [Paenibacillus hexagrammi]|uniref:Uncharacterized protein n=1 Tax=Paenibacillus hexagrammi TaxID=2908839 RepID=A0ABY3SQV5_9BACL|nr:hypothetical protein [Paenibacillus sp. YPD9-1]UJF36064.1 hypothetical protein L0M14_13890 [Paenibacillus sp. YPD9-1]